MAIVCLIAVAGRKDTSVVLVQEMQLLMTSIVFISLNQSNAVNVLTKTVK